ncbi:MAG: hypothetical protein KAV87_46155 [Desulfobacteraceae bacterium]|nr:hypothetical protein [Desulfobacteraceae bacterium]
MVNIQLKHKKELLKIADEYQKTLSNIVKMAIKADVYGAEEIVLQKRIFSVQNLIHDVKKGMKI